MPQRQNTLSVSQIAPFGVEVHCDLRDPFDEGMRQELQALYDRHKLLLFRDQQLDEERHVEVISLLDRVLGARSEYREVSSDGNLGAGPLAYHSDLAFTEAPFRLISLFAIDVNDGQSWTSFAHGGQAVERLSRPMRDMLAGRDALTVISIIQSHRDVAFDPPAFIPRQCRPAIIPHPRTGEDILYVSEMQTARIEGLDREESDRVLETLFDTLYADAHVYRHYWRKGDLLIWDNIALQHARCDLTGMVPRRLRRIVGADRSFFDLCPQFALDDPRVAAWASGQELAVDERDN